MNKEIKDGLMFYIKGLLLFSLGLILLISISNIIYLKDLNNILINQDYWCKSNFKE